MIEDTLKPRGGKRSQVTIGNDILGDFEQWMYAQSFNEMLAILSSAKLFTHDALLWIWR